MIIQQQFEEETGNRKTSSQTKMDQRFASARQLEFICAVIMYRVERVWTILKCAVYVSECGKPAWSFFGSHVAVLGNDAKKSIFVPIEQFFFIRSFVLFQS
jgi:hypothetical protein